MHKEADTQADPHQKPQADPKPANPSSPEEEEFYLDFEASGEDSDGNKYGTIQEMWKDYMYKKKDEKDEGWYEKGLAYWENSPSDISGVLGDYGYTHPIDIADSEKLLEKMQEFGVKTDSVLDVGAGIGRISDGFLTKKFKHVDLLEPAANFMEVAKKTLDGRARNFYREGIEHFQFKTNYDVIWIQWVVASITDKDLVGFLKKAAQHLTPSGLIVVKDNSTAEHVGFIVDKEDTSVSRGVPYFKKIFEKAGLEVLLAEHFEEFPKECIPVWKFVLRPKHQTQVSTESK